MNNFVVCSAQNEITIFFENEALQNGSPVMKLKYLDWQALFDVKPRFLWAKL
jgi:hypothetical protein